MKYLRQLSQHYKRLWHFAPGAMTVIHVFMIGVGITATLMKRDPLAALIAFLVTLMVAVALVPVCSLWDLE